MNPDILMRALLAVIYGAPVVVIAFLVGHLWLERRRLQRQRKAAAWRFGVLEAAWAGQRTEQPQWRMLDAKVHCLLGAGCHCERYGAGRTRHCMHAALEQPRETATA